MALSGQVERLTYVDAQSGFTVAQVRMEKAEAPATVAGDLMGPAIGTLLHMDGYWVQHPRFGRQFRVVRFEARVPATRQGIEKYLGSGLIEGLGPGFAERIVEKFGEQTLDILEHQIERLREVSGIGAKRLERIRKAWGDQKHIRDVMLFLQSHGIGTALAGRIIRRYGRQTMAVVQVDPYRLAGEMDGIGFLTADRIAAQMGFDAQCAQRIQAGILYVLQELTAEGHVYYPYTDLVLKCQTMLKTDHEPVVRAMATLAAERRLVIEDPDADARGFQPNHKSVYLAYHYAGETFIARQLRLLTGSPLLRPQVDAERALVWVQRQLKVELVEQQRLAVAMALKKKVLVITGGPGTGKTTIIQAITRLYQQLRATVLLAAPTGRAAKRISETTGRTAKTLHRLLEYSPMQGSFQRNEKKPLDCELLIVDESSMIDTLLMHHLLKAVPLHATVILVGDVNQLPSVGPGNVLKDIIASNTVPVVTLDKIFRQAQNSRIVVNAHRINAGKMPLLEHTVEEDGNDFYFIEQSDADKILEIILQLTAERIPRRFGLDPVDDIQALTPMHRGTLGAENLNRQLQRTLNPQQVYVTRGEQRFQIEDKVMQIRNNYDKEIFNGDIGRISAIDAQAKTLGVRFDERTVSYEFAELGDLVLAYAVSIHKAQGSEFPAVVIPVTTQHYVLLQRNLIYTGITRARRLVVLVGTKQAMAMAIKNNSPQRRYTQLDRRLSFGA
ncbi:MAG: ATP-dependent RecD-like DNA helicase [Desulfobacteraceae bacterium]|nr:MAG: ATP-dependent RecD-like DNA helicase [Desulfobacteraceae bacterium]